MSALLAFSAIFAFALLWAMGANDVANALGTAVGSRAISIRTAIILGGIFEFLGSSLMGSSVSSTIGGSIVDHNDMKSDNEFALGMFAALLVTTIWLTVGTVLSLPLSSTHCILGGVVGFAVVGAGVDRVNWGNVGLIVLSWFTSPVLGGVIAAAMYRAIESWLLVPQNRGDLTRKACPAILALVLGTDSVFLLVGGPPALRVDMPAWGFLIVFLTVTVVTYPLAICLYSTLQSRMIANVSRRGVSGVEDVEDVEDAPYQPREEPGTNARSSVTPREVAEAEDGEEADPVGQDSTAAPQPGDSGDLVEHSSSDIREMYGYGAVEDRFIPLMVVTACTVAFAHGGNDVANAIGPFFTVLSYEQHGEIRDGGRVPLYVTMMGGGGIVLGLATMGYRVMRTVGEKITKLSYSKGFAAQYGASVSILLATVLGMPISTTAVIVGSVVGVGMSVGRSSVDFSVFGRILKGWIVTLPIGILGSMVVFLAIRAI